MGKRSGYGERGRPRSNDFGDEGGKEEERYAHPSMPKHAYPCGGKVRTFWRAVGGQKYQVLVYRCIKCGAEVRSNNDLEQ